MKERYENAEINVILLETEDVIVTSTGGGTGDPVPGEGPGYGDI